MRASRLVRLLLILQTSGHRTAPELAADLEVSVRTIYRDVEALSTAGVPVYCEQGRGGGVRLIDGYRTRLTGLTSEEADAVLLTGLPSAAADLGLGTVLATAQLKMLAALPPELRGRATRIAERVHIDAPGWFRRPEDTPTLAAITEALWRDHCLRLCYRRADRTVSRSVRPLGLVHKAGTWYLVAAADDDTIRSYRVGRIEQALDTGETFTRPDDFDLATHWAAAQEDFARAMLRVRARCRVDRARLELVSVSFEPAAVTEAYASMSEPDPDDRVELVLAAESWDVLYHQLCSLGAHVEVLEPEDLRTRMADTATAMVERYRSSPHPTS